MAVIGFLAYHCYYYVHPRSPLLATSTTVHAALAMTASDMVALLRVMAAISSAVLMRIIIKRRVTYCAWLRRMNEKYGTCEDIGKRLCNGVDDRLRTTTEVDWFHWKLLGPEISCRVLVTQSEDLDSVALSYSTTPLEVSLLLSF